MATEVAIIERDRGAYGSSRRLWQRSVDVLRRKLGASDDFTLFAMTRLARVSSGMGDHRAALDLQREVVEHTRSLHGENAPDTLSAIAGQGSLLVAAGQAGAAKDLLEPLLDTSLAVRDAEGDVSTFLASTLVGALVRLDDWAAAVRVQARIEQTVRSALPANDPKVLQQATFLAHLKAVHQDPADARAEMETLLEAHQRLLGPDDEGTLGLKTALAVSGEVTARPHFEEMKQVISRFEQMHGSDDPRTLRAMDLAFSAALACEDWSAARALQERLLRKRRELLGEAHPRTLGSMTFLAFACEKTGDEQLATELRREADEIRQRALT